ncbi:DNA ligase-like [Quillaja saponaria]|uniref:DNA ligase-like n=1 Tax=Quillaja saponaria TaxID=32244 RepID=A0AAD7KSI6_QUISA|nr:DNA ligase-like [Quillaja saponaria]
MPIEMPKGLPFSVDTWTPASKLKRHHFLTHAHKDHSCGISTHASYPIYCTQFTKILLLQYCPQLHNSLFVGIEVGQSVVVDDLDGAFTVTALDANHCPGAVMFLFEGKFGAILHTGDCRLTPECLQNLPENYIGKKEKEPRCRFDFVFLDCTFGSFSQSMPSRHSAIQQVISCIWKHPDAQTVYLTCDQLGQEEILLNVFQTFGSRIYVDKASNPECFHNLTLLVPEILSDDPSSRFHVFDGFPRLYERGKTKLLGARANLQPEPLIVRSSAQWYACGEGFSEIESARKKRTNEAIKDQFGVWHVCYSMHSSKEELEWALQLLAPKWVVSTTPSCRAIELNYVRKHCFNSQVAIDSSLWKLLDMTVETNSDADVLVKSVGCYSMQDGTSQTNSETQLPLKQSTDNRVLVESPPRKSLPLTLFGRARLGLQDISFSQAGCKTSHINDAPFKVPSKVEQEFSIQGEGTEVKCKKSLENKADLDVTEVRCQTSADKETALLKSASYLAIGSSKGFSESFRKMYRSMNVPVPQPLPSLVELMNSNKRSKSGVDY